MDARDSELSSTSPAENGGDESVIAVRFASDTKESTALSMDEDFSTWVKEPGAGMKSMVLEATEPRLKIEVINGTEVNRSIIVYLICFVLTFAFSVAFIVLVNVAWGFDYVLGGVTYFFFKSPDSFEVFTRIIEAIMSGMLLVSTFLYLIAVLRVPKSKRTREMVFVLLLGLSNGLVLLPLLQDSYLQQLEEYETIPWPSYLALTTATSVLQGFLGTCGICVYVWSMAIGFRMQPGEKFGRTYYLKMAYLAMYLLIRILLGVFSKIYFSWIPFLSLVTGASKYGKSGSDLGPSQLTSIILMTVLEVVLVSMISTEIVRTNQHVDKLDYLERRTTRIAFMQFQYYTGLTFGYTIIVSTLVVLLTTNDLILLGAKFWGYSFFTVQYGQLVYVLVIPAYVMIQLYFLLPASAPKFMQAMRCKCKLQNESMLSDDQFSLRPLERPGDPTFRKTSFVLETCMIMLNLSWLPYSYGRKSKTPFAPIDFDDDRFVVSKYVFDEETDTHALIIEAEDRIVISFKGTQSRRNLKTDLTASLLPASAIAAEPGTVLKNIPGRRALFMPIPLCHSGFVSAYRSVRQAIRKEVDRLLLERPRPLFFGGHSLGGALATVASYDLQKQLPNTAMFVFTFGSPRVGNLFFAQEYDELVEHCWRVVSAKDPITKVPLPLFFSHIGQAALLSEAGLLYIDPGFFEMAWMHSTMGRCTCKELNLKRHKRDAYINSFRKFCYTRYGALADERLKIWDFRAAGLNTSVNSSLNSVESTDTF
ncbi:hypothetical protein NDN08_003304 [Rhodosorus marinus]|uniref:Fungal lipase-type domain-containing protein n=1 Tax=Rhodosorus marinus TaxID=101924 RepID=A0AAV8V084_9RHOD|nr:hypothetical protein NDN08_003304 [Rhodosorus marinus]